MVNQIPRTALVTGCSSGIGRQAELRLQGAGLAVNARAHRAALACDSCHPAPDRSRRADRAAACRCPAIHRLSRGPIEAHGAELEPGQPQSVAGLEPTAKEI